MRTWLEEVVRQRKHFLTEQTNTAYLSRVCVLEVLTASWLREMGASQTADLVLNDLIELTVSAGCEPIADKDRQKSRLGSSLELPVLLGVPGFVRGTRRMRPQDVKADALSEHARRWIVDWVQQHQRDAGIVDQETGTRVPHGALYLLGGVRWRAAGRLARHPAARPEWPPPRGRRDRIRVLDQPDESPPPKGNGSADLQEGHAMSHRGVASTATALILAVIVADAPAADPARMADPPASSRDAIWIKAFLKDRSRATFEDAKEAADHIASSLGTARPAENASARRAQAEVGACLLRRLRQRLDRARDLDEPPEPGRVHRTGAALRLRTVRPGQGRARRPAGPPRSPGRLEQPRTARLVEGEPPGPDRQRGRHPDVAGRRRGADAADLLPRLAFLLEIARPGDDDRVLRALHEAIDKALARDLSDFAAALDRLGLEAALPRMRRRVEMSAGTGRPPLRAPCRHVVRRRIPPDPARRGFEPPPRGFFRSRGDPDSGMGRQGQTDGNARVLIELAEPIDAARAYAGLGPGQDCDWFVWLHEVGLLPRLHERDAGLIGRSFELIKAFDARGHFRVLFPLIRDSYYRQHDLTERAFAELLRPRAGELMPTWSWRRRWTSSSCPRIARPWRATASAPAGPTASRRPGRGPDAPA